MFNPAIYHSYDIRGLVPQEFDPEEAYHIGQAYAAHTGAKRVVVARDMRETSEAIEAKLIWGLTEAGVQVVRIGLSTTPLFYFAVHQLKTDGGIMVTASHNPAQYNGMKMTRAAAVPIGGDSGLGEIRDLAGRREGKKAEVPGTVTEDDSVKAAYLEAMCPLGLAKDLKIAVDAGNGMAGALLPDVFKRLGGEVVPLFWELDGTFPNHEANPLEEKNMKAVQAAVKEQKADLGVAFDGDADRVCFVTEEGVTIPGDISTALIARELLREQPGAAILYDLRSSRVTREVIEASGGRAVMSKVGHSNIKAQMREEGAIFAGELSGHYYFTPWYAESGMRAMQYIIKALKDSGVKAAEMVKPLFKYPKTPEINYEVEDKAGAMQRLAERYADGEIIRLDGVSVVYPTWWANVRPSNTEPLLRLNMEADTPELMEEKCREIEALIKGEST